jgi:hypothetical protein
MVDHHSDDNSLRALVVPCEVPPVVARNQMLTMMPFSSEGIDGADNNYCCCCCLWSRKRRNQVHQSTCWCPVVVRRRRRVVSYIQQQRRQSRCGSMTTCGTTTCSVSYPTNKGIHGDGWVYKEKYQQHFDDTSVL